MERDNSKRRKVRQTRSGRVNTSNDVHRRIYQFEKELIKINEERENEIKRIGLWAERYELEKQSIIKFWYLAGLKKKTGQDVIAFVGTEDDFKHFIQSYDVDGSDFHQSVPGDKTKISLDRNYINEVGFTDALQDAYNRSPEFRETLNDMIDRTIYPWKPLSRLEKVRVGDRNLGLRSVNATLCQLSYTN